MNETPEEKILEGIETPEKNRTWKEDITIPVPLKKFLKMKKKINNLESEVKKLKDDSTNESLKRWKLENELKEKEKAYNELKVDYQKLLGIEPEEKTE